VREGMLLLSLFFVCSLIAYGTVSAKNLMTKRAYLFIPFTLTEADGKKLRPANTSSYLAPAIVQAENERQDKEGGK
jgi:hypothetical protein